MSETMEILVGIAVGLLLGWGFDLFRKKWNEKHPTTAYQRWKRKNRNKQLFCNITGMIAFGLATYVFFLFWNTTLNVLHMFNLILSLIYLCKAEQTCPQSLGAWLHFFALNIFFPSIFVIPIWWFTRLERTSGIKEIPSGR